MAEHEYELNLFPGTLCFYVVIQITVDSKLVLMELSEITLLCFV